ncbi:MAG: hypothetical protein ACPG6V_03675 [Flavobacteriales bacterium]
MKHSLLFFLIIINIHFLKAQNKYIEIYTSTFEINDEKKGKWLTSSLETPNMYSHSKSQNFHFGALYIKDHKNNLSFGFGINYAQQYSSYSRIDSFYSQTNDFGKEKTSEHFVHLGLISSIKYQTKVNDKFHIISSFNLSYSKRMKNEVSTHYHFQDTTTNHLNNSVFHLDFSNKDYSISGSLSIGIGFHLGKNFIIQTRYNSNFIFETIFPFEQIQSLFNSNGDIINYWKIKKDGFQDLSLHQTISISLLIPLNHSK